MMKHLLIIAGLTFVFTLVLNAQPAYGQIVMGENSEAHACYLRAKTDDAGRKTSALSEKQLNKKDRAATYVNMGILQMRQTDYAGSLKSYDAAIRIKPSLAEAHINRGACLIFLGRPQDALSALTTSIDLGTDNLPEALFNRAIAYEALGEIKSAYKDLKRAQDLRQDWELPARALERFTVVSKSAG